MGLSEVRPSDSPFVQMVWHVQSDRPGTFTSEAASTWEMVITKYQGKTSLTVRGPETQSSQAHVPDDAEFFGIVFKHGAFMPHLPPGNVSNRRDMTLPEATSQSFWLMGMAWQLPTYDNVETFVNRLVRDGLLVREPVVEETLKRGYVTEVSARTVRRHFLRATGLTQGTILQIERARNAAALLRQGVPILDAVEQVGYADQPHMTRSLKHFIGQTPAQILRLNPTA